MQPRRSTTLQLCAARHQDCRPSLARKAAVRSSARDQLDDLFGDSSFMKIVAVIAKEVYHVWNISDRDAQCFVLSAIGEPATLACVHAAFSPKRNLTLAKVIIRRRVIDLLRRDARP